MGVNDYRYRLFPKVRRVYTTPLNSDEFDKICLKHKYIDSPRMFYFNSLIIYKEDDETFMGYLHENGGHDSVVMITHKSHDDAFIVEATYVKPAKMMIALTAFVVFVSIGTFSSINELKDELEILLLMAGLYIFFYFFLFFIHYEDVYGLESVLEEKFDCKRIRK